MPCFGHRHSEKHRQANANDGRDTPQPTVESVPRVIADSLLIEDRKRTYRQPRLRVMYEPQMGPSTMASAVRAQMLMAKKLINSFVSGHISGMQQQLWKYRASRARSAHANAVVASLTTHIEDGRGHKAC